jgi:hypothetical protein
VDPDPDSGSEFGIRIRIEEGKNDPQKYKFLDRSWDISGIGILIFKFSSKVEHTSRQHLLRSQKKKNVEKLSGKAVLLSFMNNFVFSSYNET